MKHTMNVRNTFVLFFGLLPALLFSTSVLAIPIISNGNLQIGTTILGTYTLTEESDKRSFNFTATGGPITATGPVAVNVGTIWKNILSFNFQDANPEDFVTIGGSIQHLLPPDDAASHLVAGSFTVNLILDAIAGVTITPPTQDLLHSPHMDSYTQTISGQRLLNNVLSWTAVITGHHVPESSTVFLMVFGLIMGARKVRKAW